VHIPDGILSAPVLVGGAVLAAAGDILLDNGLDAAHYDIRQSADGGYYFNLKASNGQTIATSEVYASRSNAERAVNSIIALLPEVELL